MDATRGRQRLNFSLPIAAMFGGGGGSARFAVRLAPAAALILAALSALMFLLMPIAVIEDMVIDSGIASFVTAAQPPLGTTGHLAIAFLVALGVGAVSWFGLFLLVGNRTVVIGRDAREDGVPYLALPVTNLAAGQSVTLTTTFSNPNKVGIAYTPALFSIQ